MIIYQVRNEENLLMFETTDPAQASQEVHLLALFYEDQQFGITKTAITQLSTGAHPTTRLSAA